MSATTFGHKGLEAVKNRDWANGLALLDKALADSNSPGWLLGRAHCHTQLGNLDAALHDAELAYHVAAERGSGTSRKQMIEAQYRRSVIYFRLGRYADADCCAKWSMLLAEGRPARENDGVDKRVDEQGRYTVTQQEGFDDRQNMPTATAAEAMSGKPKTGFEADWNRAYAWRSQVLGRLEKLPSDDPGRKVSVTKIPTKPTKKAPVKKPAEIDSDEEEIKAIKQATQVQAQAQAQAPVIERGSVPDDKMKLRADFYQTNQTVTVTLFAKDVKKEDLKVEFGEKQVSLEGFWAVSSAANILS